MTASGSIGLIAIFIVDFLSLLYVSRLDDPRLTAGVGLATVVIFITMSVNVGLMIAVGALVSFVVAWAVIKALLAVVTRYGFAPFAWYRIIVGGAALVWLALR